MSSKAVKSSCIKVPDSPNSQITTSAPSPAKSISRHTSLSSKELLMKLYDAKSNTRKRNNGPRQSQSLNASIDYNIPLDNLFTTCKPNPQRFNISAIPEPNFDLNDCSFATQKMNTEAQICEALESKLLKEDWKKAKIQRELEEEKEIKALMEHNKRIEIEFQEREEKRVKSQLIEERKKKEKEHKDLKNANDELQSAKRDRERDNLARENERHRLVNQIKQDHRDREKIERLHQRDSHKEFLRTQKDQQLEDSLRAKKELKYEKASETAGMYITARSRKIEATNRLNRTMELINRY